METVAEAPRYEIQTGGVCSSEVFAAINRKAGTSVRREGILKVGEAIKGVRGLRKLVVGLGHGVGFTERRGEAARKLLKRRLHDHRGLQMLQGALAIEKVEEFVPDDRSTHTPAKLRALEGLASPRRRRQGGSEGAVAKKAESFTVQAVAARARDDIHRARGGQFRGEIQARLAELKFLNGAGRNIHR